MHFLSIIVSLSASTLIGAAVIPTPEVAASFATQGSAGFYFCNNAEYEGLCYKDISLAGECVTVQDDLINVPDAFGDSVSSVSFNQGFHCTVFRDRTCAGPNITLHYPGTHDLAYIGFNDKMSSYHCELGQ